MNAKLILLVLWMAHSRPLVFGGAGHRDEAHREDGFALQLRAALAQQVEVLLTGLADRDDHAAAIPELVDQRLRNVIRGAGDDDRVEGRGFQPALVAIAVPYPDVAVAESGEIARRLPGQRFNDLDAVHLAHQARQDRRLIARSGTDLKHPIARLRLQFLGHEGDDVGLRNRLSMADRQRAVVIGVGPELGRNEFMSRHRGHRLEDCRVGDAARIGAQLLVDHAHSGRRRVGLGGANGGRAGSGDKRCAEGLAEYGASAVRSPAWLAAGRDKA